MSAASLDEMVAKLKEKGQGHLLDQLPTLSEGHPVFQQLLKFDIAESVRRFEKATSPEAEASSMLNSSDPLTPIDHPIVWHELPADERQAYLSVGWRAIAVGKVAAVIMSGGQGTRLGYSGPKGCYNMGLPSQKSIFQMHVERILRVRQLCATYCPREEGDNSPPSIPIYIMTSDLNDGTIRRFFQQHSFFGYPEKDVFFFEQGLEPCFSLDGKVILESPSQGLSLAPDGNGGLYAALYKSLALRDMRQRGVEHLHVYGIDNVLTKSLDPGFLGAAISAGKRGTGTGTGTDAAAGNRTGTRARMGTRKGT